MSGLTVESTIDAFTERSAKSPAFAPGLTDEPDDDDFIDEGNASPQAPQVSA